MVTTARAPARRGVQCVVRGVRPWCAGVAVVRAPLQSTRVRAPRVCDERDAGAADDRREQADVERGQPGLHAKAGPDQRTVCAIGHGT